MRVSSADHPVVDAALARRDAEVAALAPVRVPRVGHLPVLDAVLDAPADELDGVAAGLLAGDVVVDAARVVLEVLVDLGRAADRAGGKSS